ncbi:MAG: TAXI family TRAP transporter solute-binding subunit [Oscillospiraceae bacterium]|nr:TAXI family TRAP transporter solute-binding subunit [Oscillospiraceae bacterium]
MRSILAVVICLALALTLCACGGSGDGESTNLMFGTGGETGTYYAYGGVLSQYVSSNTDVSITHVTSGGSQANIEDIAAGANQLGFVQSDVMSYAYAGTNLFESPVEGFSTVAAMYMEQVQIITLNPAIKTVADLEGKVVSIGAAGSGVYFNALDILGVYGLTEADIEPVYQSFGDSVESLQDGKIDAAFIVAGAPTNAVTSLATTNDVYLVSLDAEHIADLIEVSPYYAEATIAADVYGTDEDATTVAIAAVIIAADSVSEDAIYSMTSTIFENLGEISEQHAKGLEASIEFASSITDVPYHPGAAKYFAEKGIEVPTK